MLYFIAFLRWLVSAPIVWIAKILAYILAPIGCIFTKEVNGKPALLSIFQWMTTHDATIDTWWEAGFIKQQNWMHRTFSQEFYKKHAWFRYITRVLWVWRNPAYEVAHKLGYDQRGMVVTYHRDEGHLWDTGAPNMSFHTAVNGKGQVGWMFEWQYYYYKDICFEIYLGWKLYRKDPDQRCMLVARFLPIRRYP